MSEISITETSIKKATLINFISKYSNIIIQLIINSILARILTPNDYGIVAIISVFTTFFTIIADMGIGPAIIQDKTLTNKEISDIFVFTVFVGIIISIGFIIFSYPLSNIYSNEVYITLGKVLSIGIFFNVLNMVPNAILLKNKKFEELAIRTIMVSILAGIITVVLAINGAKFYALAINSAIVGFMTFVFNFYYSKINVYFRFSIDSIKKIKEFSSYQFGFNFINYFSRNLDNLLIGKYLGQIPLGYYDKAYRLMLYPVQNLTHVITPVLHPILSEHQNERELIYSQFIKLVKMLSLIGIFFSVFCLFSSKEVILIMFGKKWINSSVSFQILSISIWFQMITATTGSIFQSTGESKYLFKTGIINTIVTITCILIGISFNNIECVSVFVTFAYMINFFAAFIILIKKVFYKNIMDFIKIFKSTLIIGMIMILFYIIIPVNVNSIFLSISIKFLVGLISYSIGIFLTREYKFLKKIINK